MKKTEVNRWVKQSRPVKENKRVGAGRKIRTKQRRRTLELTRLGKMVPEEKVLLRKKHTHVQS